MLHFSAMPVGLLIASAKNATCPYFSESVETRRPKT